MTREPVRRGHIAMNAPGRMRHTLATKNRRSKTSLRRAARSMPIGLLVLACGMLVSCAVERASDHAAGGLPERFGTQVAHGQAERWRASDLQHCTIVLNRHLRTPV